MVTPAVQHEQMWVVHLQTLFFYYLPITKNKSKNFILLSLKLSEIAQLVF